MASKNWDRVNELFHAAMEQDPKDRHIFLKDACGTDETLYQEVESLLSAHQQAGEFIQAPVIKDALAYLVQPEELLNTGDRIGAYKVVREIGRGGMGAVYLAERADEQFQKLVAIKLIKRGMDTDVVLRHFRTERQILANFDHPNIARLLDAGSTETGLPYFVMEYVEGQPIDAYCDSKSLTISERLALFQKVCSAVSYAHRNLVVHRDIKPSNLLVTKEGLIKLLDFGIAKILQVEGSAEPHTATGVRLMTPEFASPEQAQGNPVTTLSDLYSLGVLLYILLTGRSPYRLKGHTPLEIARAITESQPQLPSVVINTVEDNEDGSNNPSLIRNIGEGNIERLRRRLRGDLDNIVLMAMRKEPERRYQSVDQFSDDIRRHLEGLPVLARKDTFLYRTGKFLHRKRAAVAATTLGVLAIIVLSVIAGMIQWRANRQAKSFQEFGQEVTRIEAIMRYAYLLPLHDIQQDKKLVQVRLGNIQSRMQDLGNIAYGPGYYSLGRGYLSLHRYQEAYDNLIAAWEKYKYQEPPVANALGLSLAMLYQEKLQEAEQLFSKEQLTARKAQLNQKYRDPSLRYIHLGASTAEAPEYVEALLLFLESDYPNALSKSDEALRKLSWLYEAKALQAQIFMSMGKEPRTRGENEKATDFYSKAKTAYLETAKKAQSDPQVYAGLCQVQFEILDLKVQEMTATQTMVEEGIGYCAQALKADSTNLNANLIGSRIYTTWAIEELHHGKDSSASAEKSIAFAKAALRIDPNNGLAFLSLGNTYSILATANLDKAESGLPFLNLANENFEKANARIPEDTQLLSQLASSLLMQSQFEQNFGRDPGATIKKAIHVLTKLMEVNPRNPKVYGMLGTAYYMQGQDEELHGLDAHESLNHAVSMLNKCIEINPSLMNAYVYAGLAHIELAQSQIDVGADPIPELDEAISAYKKCHEISAENAYCLASMGSAYRVKADVLEKRGKDPIADLESSREAYKKSLSANDKIIMTYALYGETEIIAARYAMHQHKTPEPFFQEAARIVQRCLAQNPESGECLETDVSLRVTQAAYLSSQKQSGESVIRVGIKNADHSLKLIPNNGLVQAYRGKLFLLRARSSSGQARIQAAMEAGHSFDLAFHQKKFLRQEYGSDSEEAKRLAESGENNNPNQ